MDKKRVPGTWHPAELYIGGQKTMSALSALPSMTQSNNSNSFFLICVFILLDGEALFFEADDATEYSTFWV